MTWAFQICRELSASHFSVFHLPRNPLPTTSNAYHSSLLSALKPHVSPALLYTPAHLTRQITAHYMQPLTLHSPKQPSTLPQAHPPADNPKASLIICTPPPSVHSPSSLIQCSFFFLAHPVFLLRPRSSSVHPACSCGYLPLSQSPISAKAFRAVSCPPISVHPLISLKSSHLSTTGQPLL